MSETLNITSSGRQERYRELLPQLKSLVEQEKDAIANIANVCAALSQAMGFFWVGCYRVYGNELLLGPFRGDIACTRPSWQGSLRFRMGAADHIDYSRCGRFPRTYRLQQSITLRGGSTCFL